MSKPDPFRYFKTSREIIRLAVMLYVRFPLSLRNVEDLLHECGIDVSHEALRFWWHRFGPMFAAEIRKRRIEGICLDQPEEAKSAMKVFLESRPQHTLEAEAAKTPKNWEPDGMVGRYLEGLKQAGLK